MTANVIILIIMAFLAVIMGGVIYAVYLVARRRPAAAAGGANAGGGEQPPPATGQSIWSILWKLGFMVVFGLIAYYSNAIAGLFVSEETASALVIWGNPVFWIGAVGLTITSILLFKLNSVAAEGTLLGMSTKKVVKWLLIAVAGLVLVLLWDKIAGGIVEFVAESDAGRSLGIAGNENTKRFMRAWFWVVPIVILPIGIWLWNKPKAKAPFPQTFGDVIAPTIFFGLAFVIGIFVFVPVVLGLADATSIVMTGQDRVNQWFMYGQAKLQGIEGYEVPAYTLPASDCDTTESMQSILIDSNMTRVVICPAVGSFFIFGEYGAQLAPTWDQQWYEANRQLVSNRAMNDFFEFRRPGSFPGSIAQSWMIVPKPEGFRQAGIESIPVMFYAQP